MSRVLIPLAPGFEEIEAVGLVDVLRRGGIEVAVASVPGTATVVGSHGIRVGADATLASVLEQDFEGLVLPGGEPGTTHLEADASLMSKVEAQAREGRLLGAICAAPRLLAVRELLRGRHATSHPSVEAILRQGGAHYLEDRVVRDGNLLTSRGPGTALEFALAALERLGAGTRAGEIARAMLVGR